MYIGHLDLTMLYFVDVGILEGGVLQLFSTSFDVIYNDHIRKTLASLHPLRTLYLANIGTLTA